jgi:hypothetical protein
MDLIVMQKAKRIEEYFDNVIDSFDIEGRDVGKEKVFELLDKMESMLIELDIPCRDEKGERETTIIEDFVFVNEYFLYLEALRRNKKCNCDKCQLSLEVQDTLINILFTILDMMGKDQDRIVNTTAKTRSDILDSDLADVYTFYTVVHTRRVIKNTFQHGINKMMGEN